MASDNNDDVLMYIGIAFGALLVGYPIFFACVRIFRMPFFMRMEEEKPAVNLFDMATQQKLLQKRLQGDHLQRRTSSVEVSIDERLSPDYYIAQCTVVKPPNPVPALDLSFQGSTYTKPRRHSTGNIVTPRITPHATPRGTARTVTPHVTPRKTPRESPRTVEKVNLRKVYIQGPDLV